MSSNPPEADTLPGIHGTQDVMQLRRENARLRHERDAARTELFETSIPPPTFRQRKARTALHLGKWAVVLPVVAVAARAIAKRYPEVTEIVDALLALVGL